MKKKFLLLLLILVTSLQFGMGNRSGQYDEEAREQERQEKLARKSDRDGSGHHNPVKGVVGGMKQATVDSTTGLLGETTQGTTEDAPLVGTVEGARRGTENVLDNTVKGVAKVATLGYGHVDSYEVEEPEHGKDDTTKIKIKIPGT